MRLHVWHGKKKVLAFSSWSKSIKIYYVLIILDHDHHIVLLCSIWCHFRHPFYPLYRPHADPTEGIRGEEILEKFSPRQGVLFLLMVMTLAHDILLQGDFGTGKVALAISVCANCHGARTAKRNPSNTPDVCFGGAELWVSCQPASGKEIPRNPSTRDERACPWVLDWWSIVCIFLDYINKFPVSSKQRGQVLVSSSLKFLWSSLLGK